jgi:hypothetical protein
VVNATDRRNQYIKRERGQSRSRYRHGSRFRRIHRDRGWISGQSEYFRRKLNLGDQDYEIMRNAAASRHDPASVRTG